MNRIAIVLAFVYFATMVIATTFPGLAPFNSIRPFVFGLPFVLVWLAAWVVGAIAVFGFLYWSQQR